LRQAEFDGDKAQSGVLDVTCETQRPTAISWGKG
jgi:hypothetical protein